MTRRPRLALATAVAVCLAASPLPAHAQPDMGAGGVPTTSSAASAGADAPAGDPGAHTPAEAGVQGAESSGGVLPTGGPTQEPESSPSPSGDPSLEPTEDPTDDPSGDPTEEPTDGPTESPSQSPAPSPSRDDGEGEPMPVPSRPGGDRPGGDDSGDVPTSGGGKSTPGGRIEDPSTGNGGSRGSSQPGGAWAPPEEQGPDYSDPVPRAPGEGEDESITEEAGQNPQSAAAKDDGAAGTDSDAAGGVAIGGLSWPFALLIAVGLAALGVIAFLLGRRRHGAEAPAD
ncbi:hypothetical protein [Brevibacterium salitolerans]|uniref:hypothetical protein n=1 Tax=Brevibacterium salitolerans TaxID=1403566 RepID=UPI0031D89792